jgi:hypothetical protein
MNQEPNPATYLGDGAYVQVLPYGDLLLTANHHNPAMASDRVYIEARSIESLRNFLNTHYPENSK